MVGTGRRPGRLRRWLPLLLLASPDRGPFGPPRAGRGANRRFLVDSFALVSPPAVPPSHPEGFGAKGRNRRGRPLSGGPRAGEEAGGPAGDGTPSAAPASTGTEDTETETDPSATPTNKPAGGYRRIEEWHEETRDPDHVIRHLKREKARWAKTFGNLS